MLEYLLSSSLKVEERKLKPVDTRQKIKSVVSYNDMEGATQSRYVIRQKASMNQPTLVHQMEIELPFHMSLDPRFDGTQNLVERRAFSRVFKPTRADDSCHIGCGAIRDFRALPGQHRSFEDCSRVEVRPGLLPQHDFPSDDTEAVDVTLEGHVVVVKHLQKAGHSR